MTFLGNIIDRPSEAQAFLTTHGFAVAAVLVMLWGIRTICKGAK